MTDYDSHRGEQAEVVITAISACMEESIDVGTLINEIGDILVALVESAPDVGAMETDTKYMATLTEPQLNMLTTLYALGNARFQFITKALSDTIKKAMSNDR